MSLYVPPSRQDKQHTILIARADSYLGAHLCQRLRNDDQIEVNPNILYGTHEPDCLTVCPDKSDLGITQFVDPAQKSNFVSCLKKVDTVILRLTAETASEVQYILKVLPHIKGQTKKRVILISSLVTWNRSKPNTIGSDHLSTRSSTYHYLEQLENSCLALKIHNSQLEGFVLWSGVIYGAGEQLLFTKFKSALSGNSLKVYGSGTNKLALVHIYDLCNIVASLVQDAKPSHMIIAVEPEQITQLDLISAVSKAVGNGQVTVKPVQQCFLENDFEIMTQDVTLAEKAAVKLLSSWHSSSFIQSLPKVVAEFNQFRGIKANKIVVLGGPMAGKSSVATLLTQAYGLPVIKAKDILDNLKTDPSEECKAILRRFEQLKIQRVEEERKNYEQAKKKKKGKGPDDFDPQKVIVRINDDDMALLIRKRLSANDCLNKGYILDGFPKTEQQAQVIFVKGGVSPPNSVFNLSLTEEEAKERLKKIPADKISGDNAHWTEQHTVRRFASFKTIPSPASFLQKLTDVMNLPVGDISIGALTGFIERNGPLGFKKPQPAQQLQSQPAEDTKNDQAQKQGGKTAEEAKEGSEQNQKAGSEQEISSEFDIDKLSENEKKLLNEKSRPIRQYLIDNVIPQLTEALLEICNDQPRDPVDFMIKYLEVKQQKKKTKRPAI